jgi:N-acetylglucosamine-6-phosphate deacetylase
VWEQGVKRLGVARALVDGELVAGDVGVEVGRIAAVGLSGAGRGIAAPGFVGLQVNRVAGVAQLAAAPAGNARAGAALAATGVTAYQPTLITSPVHRIDRALEVLAALQVDPPPGPRILGAHLEGPFLSPDRPGTHPTQWLLVPDAAVADRWLATGTVRYLTVAPELPGGLDLVAHLAAAGTIVACGHSDADAATSQDSPADTDSPGRPG